ncbi:fascin domain-containing protein [Saccharopolyspora phatthalungensis]|uniref:fascin domain-containing protein n=1 Tax=Saccharopolyspora phatthalungensis TaxID=664693 RepID=UPI00161AFDC6|nr:hypothetical protein [Saccharopolyspora phatthalungensis]
MTTALAITTATAAASPAVEETVVATQSLNEAVGKLQRAAKPACQSNVSIRSWANNRYVSAELNWGGNGYGTLRARADRVDAWERFTICQNGLASTIRSEANGKYVSAELNWSGNGNGTLRARADRVDAWEQFSFGNCGQDCVSIRSTANGKYVSAELNWSGNGNGTFRARADRVDAWENFAWS